MSKFFGFILLTCFVPGMVSAAESCANLPDCEALGYHLGTEAACGTGEGSDSRYIVCPYDSNYRKCVNYDCAGLGFTTADKSSWCETIVHCKFDDAYTLCAKTK